MNNVNGVLPVGSIVRVREGNQLLAIVSQLPTVTLNGEEGYFEFGSVPIPQGVSGSELQFFNRSDISELVYLGFVDAEFQKFESGYENIIKTISLRRFEVDDFI